MKPAKKHLLWIALLLCLLAGLFSWRGVQRVCAVAAVQNSVQRNYEITFESEDRPASLPALIDSGVNWMLQHLFASTTGSSNLDIIYQERFRAFFRGPIHYISIYEPHAFLSDPGAALARFPNLSHVEVDCDGGTSPTESQWSLLCTRLRSLPDLEEVGLGGDYLNDACIAPLAGHPRLRCVTIESGQITVKSLSTFSSMPQLSKLLIGDERLTTDVANALKAALPKVKTVFPSPE